MAKRMRTTPEQRAEHERRFDETTKLLEERIAHHRRLIAEEREHEERRLAEPGLLERVRRRLAA